MADKRKQKLTDLGVEALADDLVERMIAGPQENIQRFKAKLSGFKRSRRFIRWGESAHFARELGALLQDLKAGVHEPEMGAELMATFYETDRGTLGNCDDSSGHVGDVYRFEARELFVEYARHCADKDWLATLVLKLNRDDDYSVRDVLIDCAAEYLPESNIRAVISQLQGLAKKEKEKYRKWH